MPKPNIKGPPILKKKISLQGVGSPGAMAITRKTGTSQTLLLAIVAAMVFSLGLNVYLSAKLGVLQDLKSIEQDLMNSFTSSRSGGSGGKAAAAAAPIVSAAEHHGNNDGEAAVSEKQEIHLQPVVVGAAAAASKLLAVALKPATHTIPPRETEGHNLAGLTCEKFGGPSPEAAAEMVYWEDIPSDASYVSPFKKAEERQYLSFEPDNGGWNNIRMNMETVLATAFAMGRTLVLPPEKEFYLLGKAVGEHGGEQKKAFSFSHFFHMESIHNEHVGLDIITMTEYLENVAMKGGMFNRATNKITFPPGNRTNWDGASNPELKVLYTYLRGNSHTAVWTPEECLAAFPQSTSPEDEQALRDMVSKMKHSGAGMPKFETFVGKPVPVDASPEKRLEENWATRKELCIYHHVLQQTLSVHMPTDPKLNARLLVHFYAFLYFQNWKHDLWMKRFVRDHVRYVDEIQCAAARVVDAIRKHVRARQPNNVNGDFDTFHIRRGDFQYKETRVDASVMYERCKGKLVEGDTVYIATDERDKSFFNVLKEHYDVVFLDDFVGDLGKQVNTNYYGMIDQMVASRGRTFFGCWFSTFTAYINRLRGYHADNHKMEGYEMGLINSYYYALEDRFDHMRTFYPVKQAFYAREFPTSWRLIDTGVDEAK